MSGDEGGDGYVSSLKNLRPSRVMRGAGAFVSAGGSAATRRLRRSFRPLGRLDGGPEAPRGAGLCLRPAEAPVGAGAGLFPGPEGGRIFGVGAAGGTLKDLVKRLKTRAC